MSKIIILGTLISIIIVNFGHHKWVNDTGVIEWDIKSYYSYLPAAIIHQDMTLEFLKDSPGIYDKMWPVKTKTDDYLIVTSCGMSILYSPFFLVAHAYAHFTPHETSGYSLPYRFALSFSALFYLLLGLVFLRKILKRYFNEWISSLTLLAIAVGTNLYYYTTYEAPMPHAYNFALIAVFVWLSIRWYEDPRIKNTIIIGLLFGLITLVRPTNILVLLFFLLWDIKSFKNLKNRVLFFIRRYDLVLLMLLFFLIAWMPQFAYWKHITGHWLYFSYGEKDAGFFFGNPQIINILISYKKGWFVYTPLMAFAFAGIFFLPKRLPHTFIPVLIYILAMIYVLSSWWSWWFGGGFGLRAFIDTYAIMAIPLASLLDVAYRKKTTAIIATIILLTLIWFNTFQIRQYRGQAIHYWWMNKEAYWETFLKTRPTERFYEVLTKPNHEKARKGIYEEVPVVTEKQKNKEKLMKEYKEYIQNQTHIMDSLRAITKNKKELNRKVTQYMDENIHQYILNAKKEEIEELKASIQDKSALMDKIHEKAAERNISVDSMLTLDAIYLFKQGARE
ncbi:MAG: glycosyltransferase family 39 protein [Bacteroidales bacterium]